MSAIRKIVACSGQEKSRGGAAAKVQTEEEWVGESSEAKPTDQRMVGIAIRAAGGAALAESCATAPAIETTASTAMITATARNMAKLLLVGPGVQDGMC